MTGQRAGRFAALPFSALHFNVRISGAGMPGGDLGFSEVVFPPFPVSESAEATQRVASDPALDPPAAAQNLVLRRGFDGRLDLYRWWDQARKRQALRGRQAFGADLRAMDEPQIMSRLINWALTDLMLDHSEIVMMGDGG